MFYFPCAIMSHFITIIIIFITIILNLILNNAKAATTDDNDDKAFLDFVRGRTNFDKFFANGGAGREESVVTGESLVAPPAEVNDNSQPTTAEQQQQRKANLAQKFEAHLGTLYKMRSKWKWAKIRRALPVRRRNEQQAEELELVECDKMAKYLDIVHEYLFRVHLQAVDPALEQRFRIVEPMFQIQIGEQQEQKTQETPIQSIPAPTTTLFGALRALCIISKLYFDTDYTRGDAAYKLERLYGIFGKPTLLNETDFSTADWAMESGLNKATYANWYKKMWQSVGQMFKLQRQDQQQTTTTTTTNESVQPSAAAAAETDNIADVYAITFRKQFHKMLKRMWKKANGEARAERRKFRRDERTLYARVAAAPVRQQHHHHHYHLGGTAATEVKGHEEAEGTLMMKTNLERQCAEHNQKFGILFEAPLCCTLV